MSAAGGTPRTDAIEPGTDSDDLMTDCRDAIYLCRTIEREAAALRSDRDALAAALQGCVDTLEDSEEWHHRHGSAITTARQALSQHGGGT